MNRLSQDKRVLLLKLLVEGVGLQACTRIVDCSINTVTGLLKDAAVACKEYQNKTLVNLPCTHIQCDEIWSYVYAKKGSFHRIETYPAYVDHAGDAYTWVAFCPKTKLVVSWLVGSRETSSATPFLWDVRVRTPKLVEISTDGHVAYIEAIETVFGRDIDYGMVVKDHRQNVPADKFMKKIVVSGDPTNIGTSYVERHNGTIRNCLSRFVRDTYAFSKTVANHASAFSLYSMYYNFVHCPRTMRITPAMAAGISDKLWSVEDIETLLH